MIMAPSNNNYLSENDTFMISLPTQPLDCNEMNMTDLDALLPIEQEDLLKSFSSMSFDASTFLFDDDMIDVNENQPRSRVSVGGIQSIDYIESARDMTDQDIEDRWFTRSQLQGFKAAARALCSAKKAGKDIGVEESTRGMEAYLPGRSKTCAKFIYHVLDAFHVQCKGNPEYVGLLSEKWSTRSRDRAKAAGEQDYYQAYLPHLASGQPPRARSTPTKTVVATTVVAAAAAASCHKRVMPAAVQRSNKRPVSADFRIPERTRSL
jgi:hypothetical protein